MRPPNSVQQFKSVAAKIITDPDELEAFLSVANTRAFATENGDIDEDRLTGHLNRIFGTQQPATPAPQYGQYSPPPPAPTPGAHGRAEAARRHGLLAPDEIAIAARVTGNAGSAEATRRRRQRGH